MQPIGDLASYPRREHGGARLARRIEGATGTERGAMKSSSRPSLVSPSEAMVATTAGRFCQGLCQTEAFPTAAWPTPRLPGEDSSISDRMACRSSLAEITGNNRMNAQPRAHTKTSGHAAGRSEPVEEFRCRHSSQAGSSRESQQRLRKSSIQNAQAPWWTHYGHNWCNCLKIIRIAQTRQVTSVLAVVRLGRAKPLRTLRDLQRLRGLESLAKDGFPGGDFSNRIGMDHIGAMG